MLKLDKKLFLVGVVIAALLASGGCAATYTALRYQELDVQTKMSASIFLDPVAPALRTVFIQIRNTTGKPFNIEREVAVALMRKGYKIVSDPAQAHYYLQANVLSVGRMDRSAAENAHLAGFGGPLIGATAGALIGGPGRGTAGAVIGGLIGAGAEVMAGAATKVVYYTVITDVQISEKTNQAISQRTRTELEQGTGTSVRQDSGTTTSLKRFRTRVVSTARKVNLSFAEAYPSLRGGLVASLSGLF